MIVTRRGADRGRTELSWLDSRHTFSFGEYFDAAHMGFRVLRVINEDWVAPAKGFGTHPHRDMEIITYVVSGAVQHKDSMGTGSTIRAGDVQRMSAGTGVLHSEFNDSRTEALHLLQIWILPDRAGRVPGYEQRTYPDSDRRGRLRLVASRNGRDGSVSMNQDVDLFASLLPSGTEAAHRPAPGRHAWVQVIGGAVEVGGEGPAERLEAGDGAAVSGEKVLTLRAEKDAELLLFDLP